MVISPLLDRLTHTRRAVADRTATAARAQLDDATFIAAWAVGRAMTLEQALADALSTGD
jgi:hypothetical protein